MQREAQARLVQAPGWLWLLREVPSHSQPVQLTAAAKLMKITLVAEARPLLPEPPASGLQRLTPDMVNKRGCVWTKCFPVFRDCNINASQGLKIVLI